MSGSNGHGSPETAEVEQFVLDEVLRLVAARALAITGADGIAIALAANNAIICRASAGSIAPDPGASVDPTSGFSGACLVSGSIVRCDDVEQDSRVDAVACRRLGVRSILAVPLAAQQTIIGLVEAFSAEPHGFNDSDVRSLNLLGELILAAIRPDEEDRLAEISRRVVSRATALSEKLRLDGREAEPSIRDSADKDSATHVAPVLPEPLPVPAYDKRSRPGLAVVIAVVLVAFSLGAGLWWVIRSHSAGQTFSSPGTNAPRTAQASTSGSAISTNAAAVPVSEDQTAADVGGSPVAEASEKPGTQPEVTGIRHWTSPDSSTVVIDLQDQVQYEAHRLTGPERIYFDLHDTKLEPTLVGKSIDVQDELLQRIRIAQPVPGVTRVVLETKGASNFSVSLEENPYRLVVEVRKIGVKPHDREKVDLFAPNGSPSTQPNSALAASISQPSISTKRTDSAAKIGASSGLTIALDAGHGGWDLGTVGRKGLLEKDLVLDIVDRLGKLIENRMGAQVIYTRTDDEYLPLEKRAEIANVAHAGLFLSVHANYSDFPSARGVETYYTNTYSSVKARTSSDGATSLQNIDWTSVDIREKVRESHRFAASVQRSLYGTLALKNPGLPDRGVKEAQYVVLTGASMPAILTEVSFVSSPTDENNLESEIYRQQIADALYRGVAHYIDESSHSKLAMAKK